MCFIVKFFDYNLYYEAYSSGVENIGSFTFKIAFKKCFNIGVFYVPFCMENMDVFTFEPALPCSLFRCFLGVFMASRRYKDNAALRCALQTQRKKLQIR